MCSLWASIECSVWKYWILRLPSGTRPVPSSSLCIESVRLLSCWWFLCVNSFLYARTSRQTQISVSVPAVTSCSIIIIRRLVMMCTSTPRANADKRAFSTGVEVRLGVSKRMECLACAKAVRRKVLRGVGGATRGKKKRDFERDEWWRDGRSIAVVLFSDCEAPFVLRERLEETRRGLATERISPDPLRASESPLVQTSCQKSTSLSTKGPSTTTKHSHHSSQLTLQLGINANLRSTITNFECKTLKGRKNKLFTCKSNPCSWSGAGSPSFAVHESGS